MFAIDSPQWRRRRRRLGTGGRYSSVRRRDQAVTLSLSQSSMGEVMADAKVPDPPDGRDCRRRVWLAGLSMPAIGWAMAKLGRFLSERAMTLRMQHWEPCLAWGEVGGVGGVGGIPWTPALKRKSGTVRVRELGSESESDSPRCLHRFSMLGRRDHVVCAMLGNAYDHSVTIWEIRHCNVACPRCLRIPPTAPAACICQVSPLYRPRSFPSPPTAIFSLFVTPKKATKWHPRSSSISAM